MKEKYLNATGETAFRLWMFSLGLAELKTNFNAAKRNALLEKVYAFANGRWVENNATAEEKKDLQQIAKELEAL